MDFNEKTTAAKGRELRILGLLLIMFISLSVAVGTGISMTVTNISQRPHQTVSTRPPASNTNVDFTPYMADVQRRIKRAWSPPKGDESKRVDVTFKVHPRGELSNLKLLKSSGIALTDQAALRAVENAAPFPPLPQGTNETVDIEFTFEYNVHKNDPFNALRQNHSY